jgi:hypothetical protein
MSVAIGAAPATKKPTTARVAPQILTPPSSGSDAAHPVGDSPVSVEDQQPPLDDPESGSELPALQSDLSVENQSTSSAPNAPVNMDWYSVNNGGAIEVSAGNIKMGLSIGQNAVGEVSAGNIKMGLGFWYGAAGSSTPSCACDCHADPNCDNVTSVFDVVIIVGVAFRGDPAIADPNPLCSRQTTDVDCNGVTNIFDVTRVVNVAFRGGDPAVEFCDACAVVL